MYFMYTDSEHNDNSHPPFFTLTFPHPAFLSFLLTFVMSTSGK